VRIDYHNVRLKTLDEPKRSRSVTDLGDNPKSRVVLEPGSNPSANCRKIIRYENRNRHLL
jgi:hypothetical protein